MMKLTTLLFATLVLAACATVPTYKAAKSATGTGYSERQLEDNRWRIIFRLRNDNLALAQDLALLRAAELTLEKNHKWFEIVDRNSDADDKNRGSTHFGFGFGRCGYHGCGSAYNNTTSSRPRSVSSIEIRFPKGAKPEGANFYDARQVIKNLRPMILE